MDELDETICTAAAGLVVPMPTPPTARIRNWLFEVLAKSVNWEASDQTNVPSWLAFANCPAAKELVPLAELWLPPGTVADPPPAKLFWPPPTVPPTCPT